ncbi:hypothetical protein [Capnocytophaga felis]|uniref:Uncharacterized protein n=1 Tax=Capnocytophaga felis TaxID=2267611 RepID=A0A5M4B9L7_9FLAO|nr:hypothetical protein [Capnocytophaga felis]GET46299.1 hypothetical protein RCZ01_16010 [Capnocytophaga felis]GET48129.1 hypothetical protein RCZ02_09600 [Capnocytophaga felis]
MQETYYFHLFLAHIAEGKTKEYDTYVFDEENNNPLFFKELRINDYAFGKYGIEVLQPDFRYELPLSELLKHSLLKKEHLSSVEEICKTKGISPNSYIILYRRGLKIPKNPQLSHPDLHYIGEYEMDENALISKKILFPHLF